MNAGPKIKRAKQTGEIATGQCLCGAVVIEIEIPAFWAWHDHSRETQIAHGAASATYIGCWRSKVRIVNGAEAINTFTSANGQSTRSFCKTCGTPLTYARSRDAKMINLPRALFAGRTGREPRYHIGLEQMPEWAYRQEPVKPLKGYPGVMVVKTPRAKAVEMNPFA
jgi:hypothetical protein